MKRGAPPTRKESLRDSYARRMRETGEGTTTPGPSRQKRSKRPTAISPASPAQRRKVRDMACIVTALTPSEDSPFRLDPAHLCPRSHGGCDDPLCVVPLHRTVHRDFDDGRFDLLPHLRPSGDERRWLPELQHALDHYDGDLISLLQRLTGERWRPESWVPTAGTPIGDEG